MIQCKECLLDMRHGAELDQNGVCQYCNIIAGHIDVISRIGKQEDLLMERLKLFRDQGKYDCIVGLSGGKDSSYLIYRLKSHYNARVLSFTFDNGFLTDYAKENINSIVSAFGIDHIWVAPAKSVIRALYRTNLSNECRPCSACVHMGESAIWKLAFEQKIPFIITGRTPEQILRRPDEDFFVSAHSLLTDNFSPYNKARVEMIAAETLRRIEGEKRWLLPENLWHEAAPDLYLTQEQIRSREGFAPEYLAFFLYEKHDEIKIIEVLEKETDWRWASKKELLSHHDCAAHEAAGFLYYKMHGVPFAELETSALIRHRDITGDQGERIIQKDIEHVTIYPKESIRKLSQITNMYPLHIRHLPYIIRLRDSIRSKIKRILSSSSIGRKIVEMIQGFH